MRQHREARNERDLLVRVAYVLRRYPTLSETFVSSEVRSLAELGAQPVVCSLLDSSLVLDEHADSGVCVLRAPFLSPRAWIGVLLSVLLHPIWLLRLWGVMLRVLAIDPAIALRFAVLTPKLVHFARCCAALRVGHFHAHFSGLSALSAEALARLLGVRHSFTFHTLPERDRPLFEMNVMCADSVIANSVRNRDGLLQRFGPQVAHKLFLVRSGLGLLRSSPQDLESRQATVDILAVGRLVPKKGFDVLLEALAILAQAGRCYSCTVVGSGPEQARLSELAANKNLREVRFLGSRANHEVQEMYREARLVVAPSRRSPDGSEDGLPVVVTEALSAGTPVVSTPIGGIPEVVIEGVTGCLVPPDNASALAEAIEGVLEDNDHRLEMGRAAIQLIGAEYNASAIMNELLKAFGAGSRSYTCGDTTPSWRDV